MGSADSGRCVDLAFRNFSSRKQIVFLHVRTSPLIFVIGLLKVGTMNDGAILRTHLYLASSPSQYVWWGRRQDGFLTAVCLESEPRDIWYDPDNNKAGSHTEVCAACRARCRLCRLITAKY